MTNLRETSLPFFFFTVRSHYAAHGSEPIIAQTEEQARQRAWDSSEWINTDDLDGPDDLVVEMHAPEISINQLPKGTGPLGGIVHEIGWLRARGWGAEDDAQCESCDLSEWGGKNPLWAVCGECCLCGECGHDKGCSKAPSRSRGT